MPRFSIESLIASRDVALECYETIARAANEALSVVAGWNVYLPSVQATGRFPTRVYCPCADGLDPRVRREIDRAYWRVLIAESGIRDTMSAKAMRDLTDGIEGDDCPELTAANVEATCRGLAAKREEMFGDFILSIYQAISWDHKTNHPAAFSRRMVLTRCGSSWQSRWPDVAIDSPVYELERALAVLADLPAPNYDASIRRRISEGVKFGEWVDAPAPAGEPPTFRIKFFKNRNGHVEVRPDLIEEMNRIIAAAWPDALPW